MRALALTVALLVAGALLASQRPSRTMEVDSDSSAVEGLVYRNTARLDADERELASLENRFMQHTRDDRETIVQASTLQAKVDFLTNILWAVNAVVLGLVGEFIVRWRGKTKSNGT